MAGALKIKCPTLAKEQNNVVSSTKSPNFNTVGVPLEFGLPSPLFQNCSLAVERTSVLCWFDNLGLCTFIK